MRRKAQEIKEIAEIRKILGQGRICSLAMIDKDKPYVVPLNYGYDLKEGSLTLYFHCAHEGRKIDILKDNNTVAFNIWVKGVISEEEKPCRCKCLYQSIMGSGSIKIISEEAEKATLLTSFMKHQTGREYSFSSENLKPVTLLKLVSTDFTAKHD